MKVGDVVWIKTTENFWFAEVKIVAETTRSWVWVTPSLTEPWYVEHYGKKLPKNLKLLAVSKLVGFKQPEGL